MIIVIITLHQKIPIIIRVTFIFITINKLVDSTNKTKIKKKKQ